MSGEYPKCHGDEYLQPCEYCGVDRRIPHGHIGVTDPPPVPLGEWQTCDKHGPTVDVRWRSGDRCPLCESYESERRLMTEGVGRRIAEAAYRLGAKDMRGRAARVAQGASSAQRARSERVRIVADIHTLDPVRTEPDWTGMIRAALEATDEGV